MTGDIINGVFEMSGGFFILLSVIKTLKDKEVHGVSWITTAFFMTWGFWNLYYYPSLDQWFSFVAGIWIVTVNTVWVALLIYYSHRPGGRRVV